MFNSLQALKEYIQYASVSTDPEFHKGMQKSRQFIASLLKDIGFKVQSISTPLHPIILAQRKGNPSWPHIIIYAHYDVQPPDPIQLWSSPPFNPQIRNRRIYGRGAADNKGPQLALISAVARVLEKNPQIPLQITFLIEGEEEIGSPSFSDFLKKYKQQLAGDFVLLSDTLSPDINQLAISIGLRGIVCVEAQFIGPRMDLHSGIHGGAILNPIQAAAELCATLHTSDGRVNIDGFYDDVLPVEKWEREELAKMKESKQEYANFLGIKQFHTPEEWTPFEAIRFAPTLEINGIGGGYQGKGIKTIIPSEAFIKISCRLVPAMNPQKIQQILINTLQKRCSTKVSLKITPGHCAASYLIVPPDKPNTPHNSPPILATAFRIANKTITETFGNPPLLLREGGSIPIIEQIKRELGLDSLMIGMVTPESNPHSPDENMHIDLFEKGICAFEKLLTQIAQKSSFHLSKQP
jgi:acetylornithine deacetylase/succinyl-diaminopimelate desuccinylase-like protein